MTELPLSGHLGISKTHQKVLSHFYWPGLHRDVVKFCRACQTCQVVGKPILLTFCKNFSAIVEPLTNLLYKHREFQWSAKNQTAFQKVKGILTHHLVLVAPNFTKLFKLAVDDSDIEPGVVLLQDDDRGIDHPVCYFSKEFTNAQKR